MEVNKNRLNLATKKLAYLSVRSQKSPDKPRKRIISNKLKCSSPGTSTLRASKLWLNYQEWTQPMPSIRDQIARKGCSWDRIRRVHLVRLMRLVRGWMRLAAPTTPRLEKCTIIMSIAVSLAIMQATSRASRNAQRLSKVQMRTHCPRSLLVKTLVGLSATKAKNLTHSMAILSPQPSTG